MDSMEGYHAVGSPKGAATNPLAAPLASEVGEVEREGFPEGEEGDGGSLFWAVVSLLRCMVGPAALYIPRGFRDAGIGGSCLCFAASVALFALGTTRLVQSWCYCAERGSDARLGIEALARELAGVWCDRLVKFCVLAVQCGVCVTYFIFVAENLGDLLPARLGGNVALLIAVMALLEAPLALTTRIQRLGWLNAAGNVLVGVAPRRGIRNPTAGRRGTPSNSSEFSFRLFNRARVPRFRKGPGRFEGSPYFSDARRENARSGKRSRARTKGHLARIGRDSAQVALALIAGYALVRVATHGPRDDVRYAFAPLGSTLTFAGTAIFAFEGTAAIVVPVCNAASPRHRRKLAAVTVATVAVVAAVRSPESPLLEREGDGKCLF